MLYEAPYRKAALGPVGGWVMHGSLKTGSFTSPGRKNTGTEAKRGTGAGGRIEIWGLRAIHLFGMEPPGYGPGDEPGPDTTRCRAAPGYPEDQPAAPRITSFLFEF